jgi:hypothetical protein
VPVSGGLDVREVPQLVPPTSRVSHFGFYTCDSLELSHDLLNGPALTMRNPLTFPRSRVQVRYPLRRVFGDS